jgi:hypothetical protein
LAIFSGFGIMYQVKSGNPDANWQKHFAATFTDCAVYRRVVDFITFHFFTVASPMYLNL